MILNNEYAKMMSFEHDIVVRQTAELSHAESLLQPQPGGNCLNWVMGHLVDNLVEILRLVGGEPPTNLPDLSHYGFGSEPILGEEEGVVPLPILLESYELLTQRINDRLSQLSLSDFDEEIDSWQGKKRRGYLLLFSFFHNSYHLGQLEHLRNLTGKTEKVI